MGTLTRRMSEPKAPLPGCVLTLLLLNPTDFRMACECHPLGVLLLLTGGNPSPAWEDLGEAPGLDAAIE